MKLPSNVTSLLGLGSLLALPTLVLSASNQPVPPVPMSFVRPAPLPAQVQKATPVALAPLAPRLSSTPAPLDEPLFAGEVAVTLENVNTDERATFSISDTGHVRGDQAVALENFFRCRRTGKHKPLAAGVLTLLRDVAQHWPGRTIEIVSGYRSPPFGARHSRHFLGHAIDLRVKGVRTAKVRDWVWRSHQGVGVGFYSHGNFVHIDHRPEIGDTAWSAREESSRADYKPGWAKRARRGLRPVVIGVPVASL
jgi:uncharacterized protein YcbK (DUF882 family)